MKPRNRAILFGILILALIAIVATTDVRSFLADTLRWIDSLGMIGWVVFVLIYILAAVLFVPASILTLGAGFLYGVVLGTILVSIASTLGAVSAFLVGRYVARDWIRGKIGARKKVKELDRAVSDEGWKIVALTRMSPIFPYNALNYAWSLTGVSLRHYFWASWLGMLPWTIVYVYIGSLASSIVTVGSQGRTTLEWVVLVVGFIVTAVLVWYVARLARDALKKRIDAQDL